MGYNSRSHTETPEFLQEALDRCLSLATLKRLFGQHNDCDALQKALKDASTRYDPMCLDELPWKSITIETDTPSVQVCFNRYDSLATAITDETCRYLQLDL